MSQWTTVILPKFSNLEVFFREDCRNYLRIQSISPGTPVSFVETRRRLGPDTGILCLMSGNYVQRGEPAIFDKWSRAKTAVENGADLVLELPITVAINAAGYFADGAVACLDAGLCG